MVDEDCPTEPQTCEEYFTAFLTPKQIAAFEALHWLGGEFETLEEVCVRLEALSSEDQMHALDLLPPILRDANRDGIPEDPLADDATIQQVIGCLERVLGLQTEEPLEG